MTFAKYEVEKFNGLNDFEDVAFEDLCTSSSKGLLEALEGDFKFDKSMNKKDMIALLEKAHNAIVMSLVIRS